jgi:DNA-binding response OmpR family regulator
MSEELKNKILWIEDETDILEIGKDLLEEEGYAVSTAADGVEGLKKIYEIRPDLIILDMNLPKMSGMEVYQKIYNIEKKKTHFSGDGLDRTR